MDKVYYWALMEFREPDTGDNRGKMAAPGVRFYSGLHVARSRSEVFEDIRYNFFDPRHIEVRRVPELRPVFDEKREQVIGYKRADSKGA